MKDLREYIALLREKGQLVVVDAPVDPVLEMAEVADRVVKAGGPALLFTNPKGYSTPVLMNQFGSPERMCLALGVDSYAELSATVRGADGAQRARHHPGQAQGSGPPQGPCRSAAAHSQAGPLPRSGAHGRPDRPGGLARY